MLPNRDILVRIRLRIRESATLTNGFGSGSGSCYFPRWPSRRQLKTIVGSYFFAYRYYFLKLHFHHFSEITSHNKSQNSRNQGFSYYFCLTIEGSGFHTYGSGRPKTIRILIWIRKTDLEKFIIVNFNLVIFRNQPRRCYTHRSIFLVITYVHTVFLENNSAESQTFLSFRMKVLIVK